MNFQTMNKQRKFILIAAAIGVISLFLPWISSISLEGMPGGYRTPSYSGFSTGGLAYLVLLGFAAAGIVCVMGNQTVPLEKTFWFVALAGGGIAAILMLINFLRALDTIRFLGFGFYLSLLAALAIVYFAWQFRRPGDDIRSGFNSMKNDINKQVNTGPSSTTNTYTGNTSTTNTGGTGTTNTGSTTNRPSDPTTGI